MDAGAWPGRELDADDQGAQAILSLFPDRIRTSIERLCGMDEPASGGTAGGAVAGCCSLCKLSPDVPMGLMNHRFITSG